jgi:MFS transporter, DHA1 family, multidrug resistance protein
MGPYRGITAQSSFEFGAEHGGWAVSGLFRIPLFGLGLILASYGLARLVSNLPAAVLVRRLNVRSLLLGSLVINGLTAGLSIGASAPWQLLASRIIQGGCSAIVQASILVWLLVKASPSSRGQVMALSEALYAVVGLLAPLGTGLLASVLGWGAAFVAATAGAFGAFVAILTATTADDVPRVSDVPGDQARSLRGRLAWTLGSGGVTLVAAYVLTLVDALNRFGIVNTLLPVVGSDQLGLSPLQVAVGLALTNLVGIGVLMVSGRLGDRFGRIRLVAPGLLLLVLCQSAVFGITGQGWYFAIVALQGAGFFISAFPTSLVGDALPPHLRSIGITGYRLTVDGALLLAPLLVGVLADWHGFGAALTAILCTSSAALLATWLLLHRPGLVAGAGIRPAVID